MAAKSESSSSPQEHVSNAEKFDRLFAEIEKVRKTNEDLRLENAALKSSMAQTKEARGKTPDEIANETREVKLRILRSNGMMPSSTNRGFAIQSKRLEGDYLWSYIISPKANRRKDPGKRINYNVIYPFRCDVPAGRDEVEKKKNIAKARGILNERLGGITVLGPMDVILTCHGKVAEIPQDFIDANNNARVYEGPKIDIGIERSLQTA